MTYPTLLVAVLSFASAAIGEDRCSLHVRVVDPFGVQLQEGYSTIIGREGKLETGKEQFVPCGAVAFSFVVLGFRTELVTVTTRPGLQFLTIGMRPAPIEDVSDSGRIIAVEVTNFTRFKGCERLRIIPIFRPQAVIETLVSHRGGAGVPALDPGTYSLVLIDKTGVCGFAVTTIDGNSPVKVNLEPFVK